MRQSRLDPSVADEPTFEKILTSYDKRHLVIYADLLETEADGGEWDEAALLVLRIDPVRANPRTSCLGEPSYTCAMVSCAWIWPPAP
jgi:hypothetical protein